jgi:uncharacterized protein
MKSYNDYNTYLRKLYGTKVCRIGLDAGFTCPNRDGTKGIGGCSYCNSSGSRASYADTAMSAATQLESRIAQLKKKGAKKFIAYFQAFSNTYAPVGKLKETYDCVLPFNDVVGISIGTRPDTVDEEKLALISSYKKDYEVWIEYGLQSIHDKTLEAINRGHGAADFLKAVRLARRFGVKVSAHIILGLPGESHEEMLETARALNEWGIDGVKIHLLHILKGSLYEKLYNEGKITLLGQDEYAELVCDFLERLPQRIIIQRLTGQGSREDHVAPEWALDKLGTIKKIEEEFERRKSYQGRKINVK